MWIKKIEIENYRGVGDKQIIPLAPFSSIVGKNDSGKSIVLNAIASFLDCKTYPIVESDFNDSSKPIRITCHFRDAELKQLLEDNLKSKLKKDDGLSEFIEDLIIEDSLIIQKSVSQPGKSFREENVLIQEFDHEEFASLYTRSDSDLGELLRAKAIVVPVDGKGRNSKFEKIKHIREHCVSANIPIKVSALSDEYKISSFLPEVELFVSDYGLKADTTFKTNSVSEIQDYFIRETSDETKKLSLVESEICAEMRSEAESIKGYMTDYVSSLEKVEITPNISWKDAIKSVDVQFQFAGDAKLIPMSHKGTGYRRLFMVARFRYLAERSKGNNIIFLIEEPETFLHPSAQDDLLNSLQELSDQNQIVVTTHSPVFAGATSADSVVLCRKENQSIYEAGTADTKRDFVSKIIDELGIRPHYNLRDQYEKIVFVESKNDAAFYDLVCSRLLGVALCSDPKILVLPFGGGEDINSFVNIDHFERSNRPLFLLIDSDKHLNNQAKQQARIDEFIQKPDRKGYILNKSCIENYYHPRAFERANNIAAETFPEIQDNDNVKTVIKEFIESNGLHGQNIKEKNNHKVFEETTTVEWQEIIENELMEFLQDIVT